MTREEFIKVLDEKGYSYNIKEDKIIVTNSGTVNLDSLKTIPPKIEFKNIGNVNLRSLKSLPLDIVFNNKGDVILSRLESITPLVKFSNKGDVIFIYLEKIHQGVELFNNKGRVDLGLKNKWGYIKRISTKDLLNAMIKRNIFSK